MSSASLTVRAFRVHSPAARRPPARGPAPCGSPRPPPRSHPRRSAPRRLSRELLHADRPVLPQRGVRRQRDHQGVPCLADRAGTFRPLLHRQEETLQLSAIGGLEPIEKIAVPVL